MTDSAVPPPPEQPATESAHGPIGTPRSVGLTILVTVVTFGFWRWIWSYWNGEELKNYRRDGVGGVAFLLFTIFIYPVTYFLMASEVEKMYRDAGEEPRITTMWGFWFLLPLIGDIIWYVRMQNALNEFWQARGGSTSPGLA